MNVSESCRQLDDVIPQHAFGQQTVLGEHGLLPKLLVFMLRVWPGGVGSTEKNINDSSSSIVVCLGLGFFNMTPRLRHRDVILFCMQ